MKLFDFIKNIVCKQCDCKNDLVECEIKLKEKEFDFEELRQMHNLLVDNYDKLSDEFEALKPKEFVYDFIPETWKQIEHGSLVTRKYVYDDTVIPQDLTDLLDSSYVSREYASECIYQFKFTKETPIKEILLKVYNRMIKDIKYVTNEIQYGIVDQWDNGDLAIVSRKGDCDLSSRAFIRVVSDILSMLEHPFSEKNLFLFVGYFSDGKNSFGHAWVQVNIDSDWYLFELTKESTVGSLHRPTKEYTPYFCHNNRVGWYMDVRWVNFL